MKNFVLVGAGGYIASKHFEAIKNTENNLLAAFDIAEYVVEACEEKYQGIYILSKENVIIRELGEKIAKIIPNVSVKYTEISFQDARNYRVDNTKSLTIFKYRPKVTVEDEVNRMVKVFRENRVKNPEDIVYHNGLYIKKLNK